MSRSFHHSVDKLCVRWADKNAESRENLTAVNVMQRKEITEKIHLNIPKAETKKLTGNENDS